MIMAGDIGQGGGERDALQEQDCAVGNSLVAETPATREVGPEGRVSLFRGDWTTESMAKKPRTIDDYLAAQDAQSRTALQKLRRAIQAAAPQAEECISYGMPAFRLDGKLIAGFRAAANHCSYHPMSGATVATLRAELADYDTSPGTIRFSPRAPLPATVVRKLVKARIAELAD